MPVTGQGRVMSYSHAAPPLSEAGVTRGRRAVSLGVLGVYDFQGQLMITDDKDARAAYESSKIMDRLFQSVRCTTPKLEEPFQAAVLGLFPFWFNSCSRHPATSCLCPVQAFCERSVRERLHS